MKKLREAAIVFFLIMVILLFQRLTPVDAETVSPERRIGAAPFQVDCTAYCDEGTTASGKSTVEGLTIAGAVEWMGCAAVLYEVQPDGSIGDIIGIYQFTDTGYGRDGDIPRGETVDIYIESEEACFAWGRREVYLQVVDGRG